jgi:hypothetical protein
MMAGRLAGWLALITDKIQQMNIGKGLVTILCCDFLYFSQHIE